MSYAYLLIDLPSHHEVEWVLATECDSVRGILSNMHMGSKVKHVRATTLKGLAKTVPQSPYSHVKYVHLACHGDENGVSLIGAKLPWSQLAQRLVQYVPPLDGDDQRVLCLSCCYSKSGARKMQQRLRRHFTAVYYLTEPEVGYDTSMVVWSMFYYRKSLQAPVAKIKSRINQFFDHDPIEIHYYDRRTIKQTARKKELRRRR